MNEDTITITKKEYADLLEARGFLNALRNAGVDNWDGYGYAQEDLYGDDE